MQAHLSHVFEQEEPRGEGLAQPVSEITGACTKAGQLLGGIPHPTIAETTCPYLSQSRRELNRSGYHHGSNL